MKSHARDAYIRAALPLRKEEKARNSSISNSDPVTRQCIRCDISTFNNCYNKILLYIIVNSILPCAMSSKAARIFPTTLHFMS